jgi:hypothetical protein
MMDLNPSEVRKSYWRGFRKWLKWGILGFMVLVAALGVLTDRRLPKNEDPSKEKQAEAERAFEATEAGKRAKSERDAARRKSNLEDLVRVQMAQQLQRSFLSRGLDVQCTALNDKRQLYIVGPIVNRPLAFRFMTEKNAKALRRAGFESVYFSDDRHFGFFEEYDLKP